MKRKYINILKKNKRLKSGIASHNRRKQSFYLFFIYGKQWVTDRPSICEGGAEGTIPRFPGHGIIQAHEVAWGCFFRGKTMKDFIDEMVEIEAIEEEIVPFFDQEDHTKVEEEHWQRENTPRRPRRSLLLVGLLCVVFGALWLMVVFFMNPEIKKPQIVAVRLPIASIERGEDHTIPGVVRNKGLEEKPLESRMPEEEKPIVSKPSKSAIVIPKRSSDKKVVIIGGIKIKEDEKIRAEERPFKVKVFRQEIPAGDIKTKEKIPQMISMREGPTTREIQKKPVPKSLSQIITSDTVKLERKKGSTKAIPLKTSELEEKPVGSGHPEGMAEEKRWEKVEVKIAQKDMKEDERAPSLPETASPLVRSETAISAQKSVRQPTQLNHTDDLYDTKALNEYDVPSDLKEESISAAHLSIDPSPSIEAEERIVQPEPVSLIATEEEVKQFFANYVERYTQKDLEGFLSLFSPKAVQNERDGLDEIKKIYSDFFRKSQELRYHIEDMRIRIYQNTVYVVARYQVDQILKQEEKRGTWRGDIRWILVGENGALKIHYLDYRQYRHQKSP